MTRSSVRSGLAAALFLPVQSILCVVASGVSVRADDVFLRGDINDDGRISIADFHAITLFLYRDVEPACLETLDVNDDGGLSLFDRDRLENVLFHWGPDGERYIPAPYPAPGVDPTGDEIACVSYSGQAAAISDPGAVIEILDAVMPGGDDPTVVIKVRISHSRAIAGLSGVLGNPDGIFTYDGRALDVDGTNLSWQAAGESRSERNTFFQDDSLVFLHHEDWSLGRDTGNPEQGAMPPATDHIVLKLYACMAPGTKAGTYPLTLADAEMADFETARSIFPERISGTLTVEADVAPDADCGGFNLCSFFDPYEPEGPEDVQAQFAIGIADAERGEVQTVPVSISSNVPVEGFTLSIDYDEDEIQCLGMSPVLFSGADWELFEFDISNDPRSEANRWWGGSLAARAVFSFDDPSRFLPPGDLQEVLLLDFAVSEDAEPGFSEIPFRSGALLKGERVRTSVRAFGQDLTQGSVTCFKPYGGSPIGEKWSIEFGGIFVSRPENLEFLRGDANLDGVVSISDAATLRRALFFQDEPPLPCDDAGDADDGGSLGIGDAIVLLDHVFAGSSAESLIPSPYPEPGLDPTHDALACVDYRVEPAEVGDASVRLGTVEAGPGEEVLVPILITSDVDTEAYQLVVGYDPEEFTPRRGGLEFDGTIFDELGPMRGYATVEPFPQSGYFVVGVLASFGPDLRIPAGEDVVAGRIRGSVSQSVEPGTEITLRLTEGDANTRAVRNELTYVGAARLVSVLPRVENGIMRIVADQIFFRGDANFDQQVNVADPVFTLAHLFAAGDPPICPDAADADDSGRIDTTDAILTLNYLFRANGSTLAPPHPEKGRDPTPENDELGPCGVPGTDG